MNKKLLNDVLNLIKTLSKHYDLKIDTNFDSLSNKKLKKVIEKEWGNILQHAILFISEYEASDMFIQRTLEISKHSVFINNFNFCPFCGKEITIDELTEE